MIWTKICHYFKICPTKGTGFVGKLTHYLLLILLLVTPPLYSEVTLNIEADHFSYNESGKEVNVSSNVIIKMDDIELNASALTINLESNTLNGTGNITLTRGESSTSAQGISMNIKEGVAELTDVRSKVHPKDTPTPFYLHAESLIDHPDYKKGRKGLVTSCDLDHPHYWFSARDFEYKKEKRIIGKNAVLYYPLWFIPFGLYSPLYVFELGKRQIIWNFPTIGEKKNTPGWGWFAQHTIDYNYLNGQESSVYVDWYQFKGYGVGIRHQYQFGDDTGEIYYYNLTEQDTKVVNDKFSWKHGFQMGRKWRFDTRYSRVDAERINARGRVENQKQGATLNYDDFGYTHTISVDEDENFIQNFRNLSVKMGHQHNSITPYGVTYSQNDNLALLNRTVQSTIFLEKELPFQNKLRNDFKYIGREGLKSNDTELENRLQSTTTYTQTFNQNWNFKLIIDHLFDPDGNRVTGDAQSFFFKHPEINVAYKPNLEHFNFSTDYTIARYQEHQVVGNNVVKFPEDQDFEVQPNTYILKHHLDKRFGDDKTTFIWNMNYDQYTFKTPGFGLLESDSNFSADMRPEFHIDRGGFFQMKTIYYRKYVPGTGNSPFLSHFQNGFFNQNTLNQHFIFYKDSPDKYAWDNSFGFDYVRDRYTPYTTEIRLNPNKAFNFKLSTTADINNLRTFLRSENNNLSPQFDEANVFRALVWNVNINPSPLFRMSYDHSQDINRGQILSSQTGIHFKLGGKEGYHWEVSSEFNYVQPDIIDQNYALDRYEMQTLSLTKYQHCRTVKFSYNRLIDEYRILFTLLAFPDESFGYTQNRDVTRFEGFVDKSSNERL